MLDQARIDLPAVQARLRDAMCCGDARTVERITSTQAGGWRGAVLRSVGLGKQVPASLDFVYITDHGRTALHYISSGIHHRHPHLGELYSSEDVTCSSPHSAQRAELLSLLVERGHFRMNMDWNIADTGGKTAVYWAALSHSRDVLEVLCSLAQSGSCNIDVSIPDHSNSTPLDVAVASQQWDMVKLLLQSGGLKDNVRLQNAVDNLAELAPDVVLKPELSRTSWDGISTLVSSMFGFWNCSKQLHTSSSSSSLGAAKGEGGDCEEDADGEDNLAQRNDSPSPLVFCSMQEVETYWHEQAVYVSDVCGIDDWSARQLLKEYSHDADAAIKGFLANTKLVHRNPQGQASLVSMHMCCVCFSEFSSLSSNVKLPCNHNYACSNCWRQFILAKLEDGHASHLQCMSVGCHMPVPLSEARKVLTDENYEQLQRQVLRCYIDSNPHIKWCPRPNCNFSISLADQIRKHSVSPTALNTGAFTVHCACGHAFCWNCLEEAHDPASCDQVRSWKRLINSEHLQQNQESEEWLECHTQPCPTCTAKVQRTGGCNHMICTVCAQHFCYVCGRDWSVHGPQSGGFYACTLKGASASEASRIKAFTLGVSSAVRNALRNLYRRESYYLRRYFAQTEDAVDLTTVVRHMRHLVSNALVLDSSASADRASSSGPGDTSSRLSHCGSCRPECTPSEVCGEGANSVGSDSSRVVSRGVSTAQQGTGASTSLGVPTCSHSQAGTSSDSASIPRRGSAGASCGGEIDRNARDMRRARHRAFVSLDGGEIETAALLAEATDSAHPGRAPSMRDMERQGTEAAEGTAKSSKLHPKAHMRRILQEWEQSVTNGRNVLRNTYIATYYMDRCNERLYLEALQHRLEGELGQLTEMLRQLPHRRAMLEGALPVDRAPGLRKDSVSVLVAMMFAMMRDISHGCICTLLRVLNAQSTVLEEVSLRGRQIRDQFYYVVALNQQRSRIVRLLHRVNYTCHAIVRSGRVKKY